MARIKKKINALDLDEFCSRLPKYNYEQKVVQKALSILAQIGNLRFSVSKNCWVTDLKSKDESRLYYVKGLLEALLIDEKGGEDGKRAKSDTAST